MARTTKPRRTTAATPRNRSTVEARERAREELKRTLERDTAIQGERADETAATSHSPSGPDRAPPTARSGRPRKTRSR